jgi:phosphoglycerol transferase MdoB-like AlkP superfamily enzyme
MKRGITVMDYLNQKRSYFVLIAITLKVLLYYSLMDVTGNPFVLVALSVVIIAWGYRAFKGSVPVFTGAYILISTLMFVDVLYFKYFNRSLSLHMLGEAHLLGDVKDSIIFLIGLKELLLFVDLVVVVPFLIADNGVKKRVGLLSGIMVAFIVGMLIVNPAGSDAASSINHQEFFTYHIKDVVSVVFGATEANTELEMDFEQKISTDGEHFGIARGRNLIVIQVESLQSMVIGKSYEAQELTPVLNGLIGNDTFYFDAYFQQLGKGNTSDAEFVSHNSIHAPLFTQVYSAYSDNEFHGLPWLLKDRGYETLVLHGYKKDFWNREIAYPGQGFDTFYHQDHYDTERPIGLGVNDVEFFTQSIDYLNKAKSPFYSFLITLTNHNPYDMPEDLKAIALKKSDEGTLFGNYLNTVKYSDLAIGVFIEELKQSGLYENSIIVIYGDHFGLNSKDQSIHKNVSDFLGYPYDYDEMLRIPLFIHMPGSGVDGTIETVGGQIDFMPTILNLMGITNENPFVIGRDLMSSDSGFVASQTYMLKGSFIQDDVVFEMSRDGVFKNSRAWNRFTREPVDIELCRAGYEQALKEINSSAVILEQNLIAGFMDRQLDMMSLESDASEWSIEDIEWMDSADSSILENSYEEGVRGFGIGAFGDEMDFDEMTVWLLGHADAFVAADVDFDLLARVDNGLKRQVVPIMTRMEDYIRLEYMGFRNIIYTPDPELNTEDEIDDFIKNNRLLGVIWKK